MNFKHSKKNTLEKQDKSNKQSLDEKIKQLCIKINKKPEYYTTSSCAGRITLIIAKEKKSPGLFLFRTHNKTTFKELKKQLEKIKNKQLIYFKQEPCILHVACSTLQAAQKLYDKAKLAGWKKSGIMASNNRIILELQSTEKIEMPIFYKKILVNDNFLKLLVREANSKLTKAHKKIKKLENLV